jgi:hypothetical protein
MNKELTKEKKPQENIQESNGHLKNDGSKQSVNGVETKRLIPYSVYLSEGAYLALKKKAKARQASCLVRDAINMILEGNDSFNYGYNKGIRDAIEVIHKDSFASTISIENQLLADRLTNQLQCFFETVQQ